MSNTPRTDEAVIGKFNNPELYYVNADFARTLELELQQLRRENVELELAVSNYKQALEKVDAWLGPSSDAIVYTVSKVLNDEEQPSTQLDAICEVLHSKSLEPHHMSCAFMNPFKATDPCDCGVAKAKQILQSLDKL